MVHSSDTRQLPGKHQMTHAVEDLDPDGVVLFQLQVQVRFAGRWVRVGRELAAPRKRIHPRRISGYIYAYARIAYTAVRCMSIRADGIIAGYKAGVQRITHLYVRII